MKDHLEFLLTAKKTQRSGHLLKQVMHIVDAGSVLDMSPALPVLVHLCPPHSLHHFNHFQDIFSELSPNTLLQQHTQTVELWLYLIAVAICTVTALPELSTWAASWDKPQFCVCAYILYLCVPFKALMGEFTQKYIFTMLSTEALVTFFNSQF